MSTQSSDTVIRSQIFFAEKDRALRDDVRRLGQLVGELVREQGGEALFDLVEAARRAAIAYREGENEALDELKHLLSELNAHTANDFIRAFSTYFQMVNMAEKVHRIRRRRAYLQDAAKPQPRGFIDTLRRLQVAGVTIEQVEASLNGLMVQPIFTVDQNEVTRRTLLRKQQSIARHLVDMLDPYMTRQELNAKLGQIRMEMTTGWQTDDHAAERGPGDESEYVLFFLTDVLYRMIPPFYEELEDALVEAFGEDARRIRPPVLVRFGSWEGGDMDGDPDVTARSIRHSLRRQRSLILHVYHRECNDLGRHLSQTDTRAGFDVAIGERSQLYAAHFPRALPSMPARHRNMPYRVLLKLICARLQATFDDAAFPYESPDEFIADIELIADSLRAHLGHSAGLFAVTRLLRRAKTFGFHLATLDIRQGADVHRRVIAEGLGEPDWAQMSGERATQRIKEALDRRESPLGALSSEARRTLAVFQTMAHCRRKYGPHAIGPYIVSMAHGPEDILSVLLLARWGHLGPKNSDVPIDIAPLFETVADLENVSAIMSDLLRDERYRNHLRARDDHQIVMIGYGESNQAAGVVAAFWSMHKAQQALVETAREFGIALTVFHGRGGTISRAGRRLRDAVLAAPRSKSSAVLRMTEQGERINAKYGLRGIAMRTLEQTTSALLYTSLSPDAGTVSDSRWNSLMQVIADESRRAYRELVEESTSFDSYFRCATPIDVIEHLGFGSRRVHEDDDQPAAVGASRWEFAWMQNRCLMPSWYGFATGVRKGMEAFGDEAVREMFAESHFARVLIADIELTLAKADIEIAGRYSELAGPLHDEFYRQIRDEYQESVDAVLRITGQRHLLEASSALRRTIRLRNPYVDPMNYLQIDLLRRWRQGGQDQKVLDALRASLNGIAHGMQNTG